MAEINEETKKNPEVKKKRKPKNMEVCSFIFERNFVSQDDNFTVYSYKPVGVVNGTISDTKNNIFTAKTVKILEGIENKNYNPETKQYDFPILSDSFCLDDKYVYGFPSVIPPDKTVNEVKKEMQTFIKDIDSDNGYQIIQAISKDGRINKVFLTYGEYRLSVDDSDYLDFFDMFYGLCVDKIDEAAEILQGNEPEKKSVEVPNVILKPGDPLYSDELYELITKTVKCQDEQVREIATILAQNSRIKDPALKTNMLICGPTGCGKTEILRTLRKNNLMPVVIEDAGEYTATSYVGKNVTEMLGHLIKAADGDIEKAEKCGVIGFDETDKKGDKGESGETYTTAVIDNLLPMIEGHEYHFPLEKNGKEIKFDTSHVTFAFLGAFSGIEKYSSRVMGFQTDADRAKIVQQMYSDKNIQKMGLKPEFLGRNSIIALNGLTEEDLINIINTSDESQLRLFQFLLKDMGIDFIYDDKTVEAIAKKAVALGLGARSIKKIVEDALKVAKYYVFSRYSYSKLIISPETIEDPYSFILK